MTVLFCPFCRESYENETACPEHELPLVPLSMLPSEEQIDEHVPLARSDFRHGRGLVLAASALLFFGFFLPFAQRGAAGASVSAFRFASQLASNLWTVPLVAAAAIAIVLRRKTIAHLRSARLAVSLLGLFPLASLAYTTWRLMIAAAEYERSWGAGYELHPKIGAFSMLIGSVGLLMSGVFLGRVQKAHKRIIT